MSLSSTLVSTPVMEPTTSLGYVNTAARFAGLPLLASKALTPKSLAPKAAAPEAPAIHTINDIPLQAGKGLLNTVIEIPAGTRAKYEARLDNGVIEQEIKNGKPRFVDFLGYPAMYGFLPQTQGPDDKDPIDTIVLGDNHKRGTRLEGRVIGGLKMVDEGELDYKIIMVPTNSHFANVKTIDELPKGLLKILNTWFTHYKRHDKIQITGTLTVDEANAYIDEAHTRWKSNRTQPTPLTNA
jgi:inorganic pyrophosphatase